MMALTLPPSNASSSGTLGRPKVQRSALSRRITITGLTGSGDGADEPVELGLVYTEQFRAGPVEGEDAARPTV
jgi:hypothetical protein